MTQPAEDSLRKDLKADFENRLRAIGELPWKPPSPIRIDQQFEAFWKEHEEKRDWDDHIEKYFDKANAEQQRILSLRNEFSEKHRDIGDVSLEILHASSN
ncbi:MAG TPA: hypothetical protein VM532_18525 [Burkholderiales bacterium]|nr:hypothetical protein [Burkholderiales bacterium]